MSTLDRIRELPIGGLARRGFAPVEVSGGEEERHAEPGNPSPGEKLAKAREAVKQAGGRPPKHAGKPWEKEGISRRTWERRRKAP